ncbi:hypothetical protein GCM10010524_08650 [Streptomyces mexicanus]
MQSRVLGTPGVFQDLFGSFDGLPVPPRLVGRGPGAVGEVDGLQARVAEGRGSLAGQEVDLQPVRPVGDQRGAPVQGVDGFHDTGVLAPSGGGAQCRDPGGDFALRPGPGPLPVLQRDQAQKSSHPAGADAAPRPCCAIRVLGAS